MARLFKNHFIRFIFSLLIAAAGVFIVATHPTGDRNWMVGQRVMPDVALDGNRVTVKNLRDFNWHSDSPVRYRDETFDVAKIVRVWFLVEPFGKKAAAHTQFSFEFEGGRFLAVSVEARRERGRESFSVLKGLLRQYELMYVIGSEFDLVGLRTNIRRNNVYFYPIQAPSRHAQTMFLDMMARAEKLRREPEFYNSFFNNCTSNLVHHIRRIAPGGLPRSIKLFLPGFADAYAYELGLIDTSLPFEDVRKRHAITSQAQTCANEADFSACIRAGL